MDDQQFSKFTADEQVNRLEQLGRAAIAQFDVVPSAMHRLVHAENTTFKVESDQGTFCLRICRPGYQTVANVESEIEFLAALSEGGFHVPFPYQERLVMAEVPEVPQARKCVLFRWQEGEFARPNFNSDQRRQLGETMARLHNFARQWDRPVGFDRQRLNDTLMEELPFATSEVEMKPEDRALLVEAGERSQALIRDIDENPVFVGLIHSDLHQHNVLFHEGEIRLIDFDDTGYGFWSMDIAAAMAPTLDPTQGRDGIMEVLRAYESVAPLPPRTRQILPLLFEMRYVRYCQWFLSRTDNPQLVAAAPQTVERCAFKIRLAREISVLAN